MYRLLPSMPAVPIWVSPALKKSEGSLKKALVGLCEPSGPRQIKLCLAGCGLVQLSKKQTKLSPYRKTLPMETSSAEGSTTKY